MLKMLKCGETQRITFSSTAKCNITTVPQLAPQSFPPPAAGAGTLWEGGKTAFCTSKRCSRVGFGTFCDFRRL